MDECLCFLGGGEDGGNVRLCLSPIDVWDERVEKVDGMSDKA